MPYPKAESVGHVEGQILPLVQDDYWPVSSPEAQGLNLALLAALDVRVATKKINVHGIIIARNGELVHERYFGGKDQRGFDPPHRVEFDANKLHNINSVTKSVISILVGVAIDRGWIEDLDVPALSYFPEYADLRNPEKERITVRHLLTMTDGLEWSEFVPPGDSFEELLGSPDPYRYTLEQDVAREPGQSWNYNSGCTELLAAILHKTSGLPIEVLVKSLLFDPLGIVEVEWRSRLKNSCAETGGGLRMRPRDLAKVGQLILNEGSWQGTQLVSKSWVREALTPRTSALGAHLYGYHWWLGRSVVGDRKIRWVSATGWAGQRLFVIPELSMVIVVTAWLPGPMHLPDYIFLNQYILPSVKEEGPT